MTTTITDTKHNRTLNKTVNVHGRLQHYIVQEPQCMCTCRLHHKDDVVEGCEMWVSGGGEVLPAQTVLRSLRVGGAGDVRYCEKWTDSSPTLSEMSPSRFPSVS